MKFLESKNKSLFSPLPQSAIESHASHNPFSVKPQKQQSSSHPSQKETMKVPSHQFFTEEDEKTDVCEAFGTKNLIIQTRQSTSTTDSEDAEAISPMKEEAKKDPISIPTSIPYQRSITQEIEHSFTLLKNIHLASIREIALKQVNLPKTLKKTLVLDLDETLVHTMDKGNCYPHKISNSDKIYISNENGETEEYQVLIRPHAKEFIQKLAGVYDIIVINYITYNRFSQQAQDFMQKK